jgi:hypothetical protein
VSAACYPRCVTRGAAGILIALACLGTPAAAVAANCPAGALPDSLPVPRAAAAPITFGIFPGAQAGAVFGPQQTAKPEDPERTRLRLAELRGGHPFAVHLYLEFTNGPDMPDRVARARELVDRYAAQGLEVEYVLAYRPRDRAGAADVAAFVAFVRQMVGELGTRAGFRALQVTNEVNNSASPDASDGAYPGAKDALIEGVVAADDEARARGLDGLEIGFNWMYRQAPQTDQEFWEYLRDHGGERFVAALDWVGADVYPGTFFPPATTSYRAAVVNALDALRTCFMTIPRIPERVPIHVTESGYPTGPGRSYEEQARALREMVEAYRDYSGLYNVTDYRWFLLRDGNSDVPDFQQQYGLLRDDYSEKPAFAVYRELIARLGGPEAEAEAEMVISMRPRHVRAGRRGRFRFHVRSGSAPVAGAVVRFAGRRVRTGARGRASMRVRLRRPGVRRARASKAGYRRAVVHMRVLRAAR